MEDFKILQICSYYMGSSIYRNLFQQLEQKGIDEEVLVYASNTANLSGLPDNFITSQPYNPMDRFIFSIKHKKVYNDVKAKIDSRFDLSHAHSLISNGYIAYQLKKDFQIPYIVAVRNTDLFVFFRYLPHLRVLGRDIILGAEKVVFLSKPYQDLTINKYIPKEHRQAVLSKSEIIPNGIDQYFLDNPFSGKRTIQDQIRLIFVGRVDDFNKNIRQIVHACDILEKKGESIKLTLVGRLEKFMFKKLFLNRDYIEAIPPTDKKGVRQLLNQAHIFVMPSKRETFGLVYVEAMSQGLPVIYTEKQGFDGQFEEGAVGFHVNPNNPYDIAEKICLIKENYSSISSRVVKNAKTFNWDDISDKYITLYNQARRKER